MKKKRADKNVRIDAEIYDTTKEISVRTKRKIKAVIAIAIYDLEKKINTDFQ